MAIAETESTPQTQPVSVTPEETARVFDEVLLDISHVSLTVGGVQALVFVGLTLVFALLAVTPHEGEHEEPEEQAAH